MTEWQLHNKWAIKLGITRDVSEYVNRLIDFPHEVEDYVSFVKSRMKKDHMTNDEFIKITKKLKIFHTVFGHDIGRTKKGPMKWQLEFLLQKGIDYVKAWYLHHLMDFIENREDDKVNNVLEKFCEKMKIKILDNDNELLRIRDLILMFVKQNYYEMHKEIKDARIKRNR